MSDEINENIAVPMKSIVPLIVQAAADGTQVRVRVKGNSMTPFLMDGRDTAVFSSLPNRPLRRGDIVLYKRSSGQYVMHRIFSVDKDSSFTMLGDGQLKLEPGIKPEQIIAFVPFVIRKGKYFNCTGGAHHRLMIVYSRIHRRFPKLTCAALDFFVALRHPFRKD